MALFRRTAVTVALLVVPVAFAQTYIVPADVCGAVTLHVTRNAEFPNLGERIAEDRVTNAYVFQARKRIAADLADSSFNATVPENEVVMASVDVKPEIHGNETRTEHAKTLIFCGPTPAADWQRSTGLGLEIYPQGWNGPRPKMKLGEPMRFIAVDKGSRELLRDLPMELYRAGAGRIAEGTPAQGGGMNFPYPEPGLYMVVTKYRRPDPQKPEHWLVDTSTLTFEIK